jgi:glycosyltransferase involved in cell wall biosynthesis
MEIDSYSIQKKYSYKSIRIPLIIIQTVLKIILYISYRVFYLKSRLLICSSEGVKRSILKYIGNAYAEKINVIHNPVLINSNIENSKIIKDKIKLLNIGRLAEAKNHNLLIDSIFILKNKNLPVELNIVGEGPLRKTLENKIHELNLTNSVKLVGFKNDLDYYYRNSQIFVLSSKVEGFANVLVEALSYGLSIVSIDCPSGPSEVLCNGLYGTLVKDQSAMSLANAIENQYYNLSDIHHQKSRAFDFDVSVIAEKYEELIRKIEN